MTERERRLARTAGQPVAVEIRGEGGRVDFHFPVEIYVEAPPAPVDLDHVAQHVYERLARRLSDDA